MTQKIKLLDQDKTIKDIKEEIMLKWKEEVM